MFAVIFFLCGFKFIIQLKPDHKNKNLAMLRKIYGTNFFHIKFWVVVASNVKMNQCCPQLRFFILMVRLYIKLLFNRT
jgi:hypothetical protein